MQTAVLLLTDVVGSTRLWAGEHQAMNAAMGRHHEIVHALAAAHGGWRPVDQGEGDAVFAAFSSPTAAVACAAEVQRALAAESWPTSTPLTVRIGVHVGEVEERGGNLFGDPVNRCARLRGLGSGGQTLLSAAVYELVRDKLVDGLALSDLGEHRMKDLIRAERVWQLDVPGLPSTFPPLSSLDRVLHNLPVQRSPLIGREAELAAVLAALESHRLVTLTGFGGMGKTRLALQAAAELADGEGDGVWFVDLASVSSADAVPAAIGRASGLVAGDAEALIGALTGQRLLLVLDNLEQVLDCAPLVALLLDRVPDVKVLATSREPLRVRGEQELALPPLALPPAAGPQDAATLATYAAVQLFVDRAVAVKADFTVTNENAPAVAAICQRLDGHPLAIELAAARVKMMNPQALLPRLDSALSVLTGGSRDMPGRHQTLRATIAWSYDLLELDERLLLDRMSVFAGSTSFEHVEGVCGEDLDVFTALSSLVDKSLVRTSASVEGQDRYGLLHGIKAYAAEQLAAAGQTGQLRERHCAWFVRASTCLSPASHAAFQAHEDQVLEHLEDLELAWLHVLASGDAARVNAFPATFFLVLESIGERQRSAKVAAAIADADPRPSVATAHALSHEVYLSREGYAVVGEDRAVKLKAMALALDRSDIHHMTCRMEPYGGSAAELQAAVTALRAVPLHPHPSDSPWPADLLAALTDNAVYAYLIYADPEQARLSARACWDRPARGPLDVANYGRALHEAGRHEEALGVLQPLLALGVPRVDGSSVHYGVCVAARALLALGRLQEALAAVEPWRVEVARRDWAGEKRRQCGVRAWALLLQGDTEQAADLVADHAHLTITQIPLIPLLRERTERLACRLTDLDRLPVLIERVRPQRLVTLDLWLSLVVEQALRSSGNERQQLLDEVVAERRGIYLPFGYEADLEQLLSEA